MRWRVHTAMHRLSLALLALALASGVASAQPASPARRAPPPSPTVKVGDPGDAPRIELADAIVKARGHARAIRIDLSKQYLQSASFDPVARRWSVVWQLARAKGGMTEIRVGEDGKIDVVYGE